MPATTSNLAQVESSRALINGTLNGNLIRVTAPNWCVAIDYSNGAETAFDLKLEIGVTASGPWFRCLDDDGSESSLFGTLAADLVGYQCMNAGADGTGRRNPFIAGSHARFVFTSNGVGGTVDVYLAQSWLG